MPAGAGVPRELRGNANDLQPEPERSSSDTDRFTYVVEVECGGGHLERMGRLEQFGPSTRVVVKMADVEFIDSTTLNVVLSHDLRMAQGGGSLRIRQPSAPVRRLFELTDLDHMIEPDGA